MYIFLGFEVLYVQSLPARVGMGKNGNTRGDQNVLQFDYKTVTQQITHTVIFTIFSCNISAFYSIFLLHCLHVEKRFFRFAYQTVLQLRPSVIQRLLNGFHEDETSDF